jgi:hypothetical protein
LYKRLGGPQSRSGHYGIETNFKPFPGVEPQQSSRYFFSVPTDPSQLLPKCTVYTEVIVLNPDRCFRDVNVNRKDLDSPKPTGFVVKKINMFLGSTIT